MEKRGDPATMGERSLRLFWDLSCQEGNEGALSLTWLGWVGETRGRADTPCPTQYFCREGKEEATTLLSWGSSWVRRCGRRLVEPAHSMARLGSRDRIAGGPLQAQLSCKTRACSVWLVLGSPDVMSLVPTEEQAPCPWSPDLQPLLHTVSLGSATARTHR